MSGLVTIDRYRRLPTADWVLKIRALQLRRKRATVQRKQLNERYRRQGPRCLEERGTPRSNSILPDVDQMTEYWTGVIGVPGTYD